MPDLIELLTYYVIVLLLFVGAPGVFFFIVFMPALQNTKGRMVGYKDHKTYGNSTIYEVKENYLICQTQMHFGGIYRNSMICMKSYCGIPMTSYNSPTMVKK